MEDRLPFLLFLKYDLGAGQPCLSEMLKILVEGAINTQFWRQLLPVLIQRPLILDQSGFDGKSAP